MKPHSKNLQCNFVGQRRQYNKSFVQGRLLGKHFCRLIISLKLKLLTWSHYLHYNLTLPNGPPEV